jgi:hypothetical protein
MGTMPAFLLPGPAIGGGLDRQGRDHVVVYQVQFLDNDKKFPRQTHQGTRCSSLLGALSQEGRTFRCKGGISLARERARLFEQLLEHCQISFVEET